MIIPANYILVGRSIRRVNDFMTWARQFEKCERHVGNTWVGKVHISTVFLGIDHAHGNGPPLLFETMVFGGWFHGYQTRWSTYDVAEATHQEMVKKVRRLRWIPARVQLLIRNLWKMP